jgi:hypothetical protein
MSVIYQGVSRTNTDALWQAYRKVLTTTPPAVAQPAPVQETVAWVLLREDEDGFEPIQFYGGKQKPEVAGELKARFTLRPVCFSDAQPAQRKPLTDDQIRGLTPKPDGVAEAGVRRVEVLPGVMGTEFDEVDAWSMPLVLQIARAIEAALGITEQP